MSAPDQFPIEEFDKLVDSIPQLQENGETVSRTIHNAIVNGGTPTRRLADLLHGKWLGHPLHPVLTDITIGSWVLAGFFDILSLITGNRHDRRTADKLTEIGAITAVPTAITGMTDFSAIKKRAAGHGALHGILNTLGLGAFLLSILMRRKRQRGMAILFSMIGLDIMTISAWIGGDLVYRWRIGVDHSQHVTDEIEWTTVLNETDLDEGEARRVEVSGYDVLVYRKEGTVYAIGAICSHAGGPLEEGTFDGYCVQCPWHDSVYDLRDGSVVHAPATTNQPHFKTRISKGEIQISTESKEETELLPQLSLQ